MKSKIGQILLWAGFLSGSLATVFSTAVYSRLGVDVTNEEAGPTVSSVDEESAAWQAGLRQGDVVVSLAEKPTSSADAVSKALGSIGDETVPIIFSRNGEQKTANIKTGNPWKTINWLWYGLSAAVCIGGIFLIRSGKKASAGQSEKTEASLKQIKAHLGDLVNNTETLHQNLREYSPREILTYIDETLHDDFREFAEGRDSITAEHGLEVFADVMTNFAAGERAINRAWSAAADGYIEEVAVCVDRGLAMLKVAQKTLNAA
ncbi:MAG: PDZ domain-containing protein [Pirellulaceae bacterium]